MAISVQTDDPRTSAARRQTMVDCQIRTFDVTDQRLIARVLAVPREAFVPAAARDLAYSDTGIIMPADAEDGAEARILLPPLVLVRLIQGGRVRSGDRVLDIACGGGYSTALLAGLAAEVHAVETGPARAAQIKSRLGAVGSALITVADGHLADGLPSLAPFDVILIHGAVETNLDALFAQLAPGGRLLCIRRGSDDPTGRAGKAFCYEKRGGEIGSRYLFDASAPVLPAFRAAPVFVF